MTDKEESCKESSGVARSENHCADLLRVNTSWCGDVLENLTHLHGTCEKARVVVRANYVFTENEEFKKILGFFTTLSYDLAIAVAKAKVYIDRNLSDTDDV